MALRFGVLGTGYWAQEAHASALAAHPRPSWPCGPPPSGSWPPAWTAGPRSWPAEPQASSTVTANRAVKASPGWTRGVVPAARAAVGPVIGSRQANSAPGGANTWAWP
jgi:hypothetical protein